MSYTICEGKHQVIIPGRDQPSNFGPGYCPLCDALDRIAALERELADARAELARERERIAQFEAHNVLLACAERLTHPDCWSAQAKAQAWNRRTPAEGQGGKG